MRLLHERHDHAGQGFWTRRQAVEAEIKAALANNLCRCGTHAQIVRAVQRVAAARA